MKHQEKKVKLEYFDWKLNETEPQKKVEEFSLKRFSNPRFFQTALSGGSNKFYPTNANNNELENLYKYYKSTGQVN